MATGAQVGRRVVITVLVIVALLVAADRISDFFAERAAGNTIESSQHLTSRPGVDIAGFPFLTQLASGRYDKVTVTAKNVSVGQDVHVLLSRLRVVLHTLTVSHNFSRVHANTATADATITYADLGATLGLQVGYAGGGRIKATKQVSVAGRSTSASLSTTPKLANGALTFTGTAVNNAGRLGAPVVSALHKVFDLAIPLQGIPFRIRARSLTSDASGVHIGLIGSNLSYER